MDGRLVRQHGRLRGEPAYEVGLPKTVDDGEPVSTFVPLSPAQQYHLRVWMGERRSGSEESAGTLCAERVRDEVLGFLLQEAGLDRTSGEMSDLVRFVRATTRALVRAPWRERRATRVGHLGP